MAAAGGAAKRRRMGKDDVDIKDLKFGDDFEGAEAMLNAEVCIASLPNPHPPCLLPSPSPHPSPRHASPPFSFPPLLSPPRRIHPGRGTPSSFFPLLSSRAPPSPRPPSALLSLVLRPEPHCRSRW